MHIDWGAAATAIVTLVIFIWTNRKQVTRRHQENMEKWNNLLVELNDYPPHEHVEERGPLTAEGIRMRRMRRV